MRIFVTGGNGFIGSQVVHRLVGRGDRLRCLLRPTSRTSRIDDLPFERVVGDVRDRALLTGALAGCESVVHLAAVSGWHDLASDALESTIVEGTRHILEAAVAAGARRVVVISSAAAVNGSSRPVVFDEDAPFELAGSSLRYAIAKHRAEQICWKFAATSSLEVVVVNPAETYGPGDDALVTAGSLRDTLQGWPAFACHGGSAIAHVEDVADGIVQALDRGRAGQRYILGGDNLTVEQVVRMTLRSAGRRRTPVLVLPNRLALPLAALQAKLSPGARVASEVVPYATRYWFMDSSKARRELLYRPRPARDVLTPTVRWLYASGLVR